MKDVFEAYKQQKLKKNITIVASALALALFVNVFLFKTDVGNKLQTSVTNFNTTEQASPSTKDIYLVAQKAGTNFLDLRMGTALEGVSELRVSFLFDPANLALKDFLTENKDLEIIKIANEPGIVTLNLRFKSPASIAPESKILSIVYDRKDEKKKTVINLAETSFVTKGGTYELANAPLEF